MKKLITRFLLFLSFPIVLWVVLLLILNSSFNYNYTKYLYQKKEAYLRKHKDHKKLVIIGGSNAKFNYNSAIMDSILQGEYQIVNSAVMGNIGFVNHAELIAPYLQEGDVVLLSPEYDIFQTKQGLYGNYQALQIAPVKKDYYKNIFSDVDRCASFLQQSFMHWKFLLEILMMRKTLTLEMINYVINEFHTENGEIGKYPEEVAYSDYLITISNKLEPQSVKVINEFNDWCNSNGVKMIINLPAVRYSSVSNHFDSDSSYISMLKKYFPKIAITGGPIQNTYEDDMFIDSPYHLNEIGKNNYTFNQMKNGLYESITSDKNLNKF